MSAWNPFPKETELSDPASLHVCPTRTPSKSHCDLQPAPQQPPAAHSILRLDMHHDRHQPHNPHAPW